MTDKTTLDYVNELQAYMVHVIELNAEIERLRAVLCSIEDQTDTDPETMWIADIARAALQDQSK